MNITLIHSNLFYQANGYMWLFGRHIMLPDQQIENIGGSDLDFAQEEGEVPSHRKHLNEAIAKHFLETSPSRSQRSVSKHCIKTIYLD